MKHVGCGWLSARDGWRDSHPKLLADPKQNLPSGDERSGAAFIHKGYKITFNLFIASSDFRRCRRRATTFAGSTSDSATAKTLRTHPTLQPQIDRINMGTQDPKKENL